MTELFTDTVLNMMTTTAEPEDYTGEDGLLYCGKCRTAKEAYFPKETAAWLGHDKHPTECDCQREKRLECESAEERRIVYEYRYQQRHNTLRNHVMQLNMLVRIQKFGQSDSAARIEHPADAPDDKVTPGYTLFLALGIAEHIAVIQNAVGNAATYHSQRIGKSIINANDI